MKKGTVASILFCVFFVSMIKIVWVANPRADNSEVPTTIALQGESWINIYMPAGSSSSMASCVTTNYTVPTGRMLIIESVSYYYAYTYPNKPMKVMLYTGQAPSRSEGAYPYLLVPSGVIYPLPIILNPDGGESSFSNATNFTAYIQPDQSIGVLFDFSGPSYGTQSSPCSGASWVTITGRLVPSQ